MKLYTAEQMQAIDKHAIETVGVAAAALMETAGRAVAAEAVQMLGSVRRKRVLILAGKGNNGGDGLVAARVLHDAGAGVEVIFAAPSGGGEGTAADNLKAAQAMGIPVRFCGEGDPVSLGAPDLCIDALLGVGSRGAPTGLTAELVRRANELPCPILAVDLPTGLDASTGEVSGECIRAAVTVTFGCGKVGLFCDPGIRYAGRVSVAEIGFPRASVDSVASRVRLIDSLLVSGWLPDRPRWAHKGTAGSAVVLAGSPGMLGAAALSSRATLRAGGGLTKLMVPESLLSAANTLTLEVICRPAPGGRSGGMGPGAKEAILAEIDGARCAAIGPGLGQSEETAALLAALLPEIEVPMVLDADALNILAKNREVMKRLKAPAILTPHPGEMARLSGAEVKEVQARRIAAASRLAAEYGVIVVLKGAATVVADPSGEVFLNSTGNGGMASAGMGDVLTGTIAGLLAQGMQPLQAAAAGVYLHGMAGDLCAAELGRVGLLASDLIDRLPEAEAAVKENGSAD